MAETKAMTDADDRPRGELTIRVLAMPADSNPAGDIFGGWVLSQMDIAGGLCAGDRAQGRVATVGVEAMTFIRPVKIGDVMCVYTELLKVGRTSLRVGIEAWALRDRIGTRERVTKAIFTYVALDEDGNATPVPPEA